MAVQENPYTERTKREGRLQIEPVMPWEDGGTGDRWGATWAPSMDALPDIDASAPTLVEALVYLIYGLGEAVLDLRNEVAAVRER